MRNAKGRPATVLLGVTLCLLALAGCGGRQIRTVIPEYQTRTGVIPAMPGAGRRVIAICHFQAPREGADIGVNYQSLVLGIGRHKTNNLVLGNDLGKVLAEAFAFQLRAAGFKTVVVENEVAVGALRRASRPDAVLTGSVDSLDLNFAVAVATESAGKLQCTVVLRRSDLKKVLARVQAADRDKARAVLQPSGKLATAVANELVTTVVDEICKKPEFQSALRKLAAGS